MKLSLVCLWIFLSINTVLADYDTLVICPDEFQQSLKGWIEYRSKQGYKILVNSPSSTAEGIKAQIKHVANSSPIKNVVLIGDAADSNVPHQRLVPTDFVPAVVNVKFGSEPEIATDHNYADLDADGILELNLGRIPVDSKQELENYIQRIIQYESNSNQRTWQRRINFVAGVGGFGQLLDQMIEQSVKKIVTDLIPAAYEVTMTYGSWRSPYCPDPRRFARTAVSKLNEGCLFWVYVGHGDRRRLDRLKLPDRQYEILNHKNVSTVQCTQGAPIAICLSCYTAAIDDPKDGLAELMFKQPRGPIGVISSSRVSMPYGMSIFSLELMDGYFRGEYTTLGELVRESKRRMVQFNPDKSEYHKLVHSMGDTFSPARKLMEEERKEHVHLMHLLGDPLLRLHRPRSIELECDHKIESGQALTVTGVAERPGELKVDLAYQRDRFRTRPIRRKTYQSTHGEFENYQKTYEQTQNLICNSKSLNVDKGRFKVVLDIPEDCSGDCHVRAELVAERFFALGAKKVFIDKRKMDPLP